MLVYRGVLARPSLISNSVKLRRSKKAGFLRRTALFCIGVGGPLLHSPSIAWFFLGGGRCWGGVWGHGVEYGAVAMRQLTAAVSQRPLLIMLVRCDTSNKQALMLVGWGPAACVRSQAALGQTKGERLVLANMEARPTETRH